MLQRILEKIGDGRTKICITGRMYETHTERHTYQAGEWKYVPDATTKLDKSKVEVVMCPDCQREYDALVPPIARELNEQRTNSRYPGCSGIMVLAEAGNLT
jgi:hypothetical protein